MYVSVLAANGIVPINRRAEQTPGPDALDDSLAGDLSLHDPIEPAAHDARAVSPSGPWDTDMAASDESHVPKPFEEQLDDDTASFASLDLSMIDPEVLKSIDPEILDSINRELGGFVDLEHDTEPPQVDPEDNNLGLQDDDANDGTVQETSIPSIVVHDVDGSTAEHSAEDASSREA